MGELKVTLSRAHNGCDILDNDGSVTLRSSAPVDIAQTLGTIKSIPGSAPDVVAARNAALFNYIISVLRG